MKMPKSYMKMKKIKKFIFHIGFLTLHIKNEKNVEIGIIIFFRNEVTK